MNASPSNSQIKAWENSILDLKIQIKQLNNLMPISKNWTIIFEYEIPRERGRRPDVIILTSNKVLILEFKGYNNVLQSHVDQTAAYARDIKNYHSESHEYDVYPILVLNKYIEKLDDKFTIDICDSKSIFQTISKITVNESSYVIDPEKWVNAAYDPLPSLVKAARYVFQNEDLPNIRRATSAGIPDTIKKISDISKRAKKNSERHLVVVTGVPGSGKTLVGLQFVYEFYNDDERDSVFLSGNGPLVEVLRHALKNRVFVQDVHGFLREYGGGNSSLPSEHIWVYDEAQRAWDNDRAKKQRGPDALSEPQDFLQLGEKMDGFAVIVALIGEGQEIHIGEEAGIQQWNSALLDMKKKWYVHCPRKLANVFTVENVLLDDKLNLSTSLRSHIAGDTHEFVSRILKGDLKGAKKISKIVVDQNYNLYISRNLDDCKRYLRERYQSDEDKRYGILASSKAKNLTQYGILNDFNSTRNVQKGPWYNDPPSSKRSCCQLNAIVTEFGCQGLELDTPLIAWGDDLIWGGTEWQSKKTRSSARDPHNLRLNSYRVLLTRGRDGLVIFIPEEAQMDSTYDALLSSGFRDLKKKIGPILVTAAIIRKNDEVFITKRTENGLWEFPGGKVEYGETPEDCLIREIKEELDLEINIDSLYDSSSILTSDGSHFVILFYECSIVRSNPVLTNHNECRWIKTSHLNQFDFMPADKKIRNSLSAGGK